MAYYFVDCRFYYKNRYSPMTLKIEASTPIEALEAFAHFAVGYEVACGYQCTFESLNIIDTSTKALSIIGEYRTIQHHLTNLRTQK